jgi:predicted enzyme related to lactoylglutathione lyase
MSTTTKIVTGVDYVGIPSNDLTTAREFYETVLGLEASSVWQRPGSEAVGAEFETGTVTIALINCPGLGIPFSPNPAPLALQVDDVAAARAALEEKGVSFAQDTIDSGVCHMANFKDPDGNAIMLHQRYAPKG